VLTCWAERRWCRVRGTAHVSTTASGIRSTSVTWETLPTIVSALCFLSKLSRGQSLC
jgi:hypothetical protein